MNTIEYQIEVQRTMAAATPNLNTWQMEILNWTMGLCGESGEFAERIKKTVFHGHEFERQHVLEELGDVLWYIAALATHLNVTIEEVMAINVAKLVRRYPHGFDPARSARRDD